MLENALSALLASVVGHYAELSPSDVGIGLTGGRLAVSNVKLRPEHLNSPSLPFRVISGRAGFLRCNVPWSALSSAPVTVHLESVDIVAAPRLPADGSSPRPDPTRPVIPDALRWHETRLGRVLFNVELTIDGLHVEYRDGACVATVTARSVRAHSADRRWQPAFVPLDGCGQAVAMRKLLSVDAFRVVMTPPTDGPCFERASPLIDNIDVAVRLLMCAGEGARTPNARGAPTPPDGVHVELDVELDAPALSLSRRQVGWVQAVLGQAAGTQVDLMHTPRRPRPYPRSPSTPGTGDRRRLATPPPRPVYDTSSSKIAPDSEPLHVDTRSTDAASTVTSGPSITSSSEWGVRVDLDADPPEKKQPASRGFFRSFWDALVMETNDETMDDSAYVLGLTSAEDAAFAAAAGTGAASTSRASTDSSVDDDAEQAAEEEFAREAVAAAAGAGGLVFRCRLKTPDEAAVARVAQLEEALAAARAREKARDLAEARYGNAGARAAAAERLAEATRAKSRALLGELADLEHFAANASRGKDAIIRQVEAALAESERSVQLLLAERAAAWGAPQTSGAPSGTGSSSAPAGSPRRLRHGSSDTFIRVASAGSGMSDRGLDDELDGLSDVGQSHGLPPSGRYDEEPVDVAAFVEEARTPRAGEAGRDGELGMQSPNPARAEREAAESVPLYAEPEKAGEMQEIFSREGLTLI